MSEDLFKKAMQGVERLKSDNKRYDKPAPPVPQKRLPEAMDQVRDAPLSDGMFADEVRGSEVLLFARSGVQPRIIAQLKQGKVAIEDRVDLHGMTSEQARQTLFAFLEESVSQGLRQVLVIHGKGGKHGDAPSVIKSRVNQWLPQLDSVLAFASAQPKHGGTGAVLVLLRRN